MRPHVVHCITDLAEGHLANGASQALASAPSFRIVFKGLFNHFHDLLKVFIFTLLFRQIVFMLFIRFIWFILLDDVDIKSANFCLV